MKCQCEHEGLLGAPAHMYDPIKELPFVNHAPGECKCTNDLRQYRRNENSVFLCSICCMLGDEEITQ